MGPARVPVPGIRLQRPWQSWRAPRLRRQHNVWIRPAAAARVQPPDVDGAGPG